MNEAKLKACEYCGTIPQTLSVSPDCCDQQWKGQAGGQQPEIAPNAEAIASSAEATLLGHIVKEDEKWALLAGANIFDPSESADWPIDQLAKRTNMTRQRAITFMHQNGWKLVRVRTQHKIVAVTQLLVSDVA